MFLGAGKSLIISGGACRWVRLPVIVNRALTYEDAGRMARGLSVKGGIRLGDKVLQFQVVNHTNQPMVIGSRTYLVAAHLPATVPTFFQRMGGRIITLEEGKKRLVVQAAAATTSHQQVLPEGAVLPPAVWQKTVKGLMASFPSVLTQSLGCIPTTNSIKLQSDLPRTGGNQMDFSPQQLKLMDPLFEDWKRLGVIEEVQERPRLVSPLLLTRPPNKPTKWRIVHDLRVLNAGTVREYGEPMNKTTRLESLKDYKVLSSLDLSKGFLQLELPARSRSLFGMCYKGCWYQFTRYPFGFLNSMMEFNNMFMRSASRIEQALLSVPGDHQLVRYVDDFIVASQDVDTHEGALRCMLHILKEEGWCINPSKAVWFTDTCDFVGVRLEKGQLLPSKGLISSLYQLPVPTCKQELRRLFGLALQLTRFQVSQCKILQELQPYKTKEPAAFQSAVFLDLWKRTIQALTTQLWANHPMDGTEELVVYCDASAEGFGGVLMGTRPGASAKVISMYSHSNPEKHLHSATSEMKGLLRCLSAFAGYILGTKFRVRTDNWAVFRVLKSQSVSTTVRRSLQELLFWFPNIEFIPGKDNGVADYLSRVPLYTCPELPLQVPAVVQEKEPQATAIQVRRGERYQHWSSGHDSDIFHRLMVECLQDKRPDNVEDRLWEKVTQAKGKYRLHNRQLFRKTSKGGGVPVIASPSRALKLQQAHDMCGHFGVRSTYMQLCRLAYWNGMYKDVQSWVETCHSCQVFASTQLTAPFTYLDGHQPFDLVSLDFVGPLNVEDGQRYIFTCIDHCTHYLFGQAMANCTSQLAIDFLLRLFNQFGFPQSILVDRGTHFTSDCFRQFCRKYHILLKLADVGSGRGNALNERYNQTLIRALRRRVAAEGGKWTEHIQDSIQDCRRVIHDTWGVAPQELFLGYQPRAGYSTQAHRIQQLQETRKEEVDARLWYVQEMREEAKTVGEDRRHYDQQRRLAKLRGPPLQLQERVLVLDTVRMNRLDRKLTPFWLGPGVLITKERANAWTVKLDSGRTIRHLHADRLRRYYDRRDLLGGP